MNPQQGGEGFACEFGRSEAFKNIKRQVLVKRTPQVWNRNATRSDRTFKQRWGRLSATTSHLKNGLKIISGFAGQLAVVAILDPPIKVQEGTSGSRVGERWDPAVGFHSSQEATLRPFFRFPFKTKVSSLLLSELRAETGSDTSLRFRSVLDLLPLEDFLMALIWCVFLDPKSLFCSPLVQFSAKICCGSGRLRHPSVDPSPNTKLTRASRNKVKSKEKSFEFRSRTAALLFILRIQTENPAQTPPTLKANRFWLVFDDDDTVLLQ